MDVLSELKSLRDYLAATPLERRHVTDAAAALHRPPPPPHAIVEGTSTTADDSPSPQSLAPLPPPAASVDRELQRQVAALRKQLEEGKARCRRGEEALAAARRDGELAAQRLQAQLQAKHHEVGAHACVAVVNVVAFDDCL